MLRCGMSRGPKFATWRSTRVQARTAGSELTLQTKGHVVHPFAEIWGMHSTARNKVVNMIDFACSPLNILPV